MDSLEAKFRVTIDGKDELSNYFASGEKGARTFQANMSRLLSQAGATISTFARKAGSEFQAFAGKELGGTIGSNARGILELRDAVNKLAVSSGHGGEIVGDLKDQIQAVSVASNQLQGDVTQALQAFVERTGDLETARKNLELYAKTATATSASLEDVARVGESLSSKFHINDQKKSFDILAVQAKAGAIELRDLATQGATVFAAARAGNLPANEQGVREIGALLQTVAGGARGKGTATAADTATQIQAMFSQIRQKAGKIEAMGIKVEGRDQIDVIKDIIVKTGGDAQQLSSIFKNVRAFKGVESLARSYREGKGFSEYERLKNMGADPTVLDKDFATRTGTGAAKLKQTQIERAKFYDKYLGGIAEFGAEHATEIQVATVALGGLGAGLSLVGKVIGKGGGGGIGGALSDLTAQRVFVVNWPGAMGGSLGGAAAGALGGMGTLAAGLIGLSAAAGLATGALIGIGMKKFDDKYDPTGLHALEREEEKKELKRRDAVTWGLRVERDQERERRKVDIEAHNLGGPGSTVTIPKVQNHIVIENHGTHAKVKDDSGTRSVVIVHRRKGQVN